jgi:predicted alpha/beta-fold hydrolase
VMSFSPPWWLRNPHLQTVWGRISRPRKLVSFRREVIPTPDGDELVLDHVDPPASSDTPLHFVLLHGLEGSSYSVYIQGIASIVARRGCSATAVNFRSCARDPENTRRMLPNRRPRFYHSGETGDFDFVLRTLASRWPERTMVACGASLGGNVLLKWLGEHPEERLLAAAATLSVPYDLGAGSSYLELSAPGRLYVNSFLATLKKKVDWLLANFPETAGKLDPAAIRAARTFRQFDEAATGPLHGFTGADDYYTRASSIHFLGRIAVPTLCVSAEDDPFLPRDVLQRVREVASPSVELLITTGGGHVGFVGGDTPWRPSYWAEELVVDWLIAHGSSAQPHPARHDAGAAVASTR